MKGQIVGDPQPPRTTCTVNPMKAKQLTNIRTVLKDEMSSCDWQPGKK